MAVKAQVLTTGPPGNSLEEKKQIELKGRAGAPQGDMMIVIQGKSSLQDVTLMMTSITMWDQTSNRQKSAGDSG